ncbi:MAG: hypothetical protein EB060_05240 [Proteobacteria bacterium]|nr:hypothetical protein [Pseudomonadota bacterium]
MANPEVILTGTVIITCEYHGKMHVAVCQRLPNNEPMTSAGTVFRPNFGDKDTRDTALRSAKFLFGLTPESLPELDKEKMVKCPTERIVSTDPEVKAEAARDAATPRAGHFDAGKIQVGHDYVLHLGKVATLPAMEMHEAMAKTDKDGTKPVWLDVTKIEKHTEADRVVYRLNGAQEHYPDGAEAFPSGGMFAVEFALKHARAQEFRDKGYNGLAGFLLREGARLAFPSEKYPVAAALDDTRMPMTELGKDAAEYYRMARVALMALGETQGRFAGRG